MYFAFAVVIIQIFLLTISYELAKRMRKMYTAPDVVAIVFCSTHKSLTLGKKHIIEKIKLNAANRFSGIPILRIMFHGFSHLSQISLPLLVYHPTQIILGGLLVSQLKDWVRSQRSKRSPV